MCRATVVIVIICWYHLVFLFELTRTNGRQTDKQTARERRKKEKKTEHIRDEGEKERHYQATTTFERKERIEERR